MKDKTLIMRTFGLAWIFLLSIFAGWGFGFIFQSYLIGLTFAVLGCAILVMIHLFGMLALKILQDNDPKATRITREVYYKPIKLPEKPKRRK